jgi:hypothetical protein
MLHSKGWHRDVPVDSMATRCEVSKLLQLNEAASEIFPEGQRSSTRRIANEAYLCFLFVSKKKIGNPVVFEQLPSGS